ncbi:aminotransferase class I/II-fold pyridoxal phosphate-dependent enzyme [Aromatoleum petrolei]|uniref:Aminotransferase n=1 Tax=Aromatoleum petrolei TaxID=76116 RepID=A0ABX1N007_9RHOO|nr:aminotransferase class I/II-fold pyridoxal phosphate-dependent enzyme [Aromatoleum petrolei]NMF90717.1 aminotransferase class I/II-fold pyridoxal phosphate-dependent enzyme [Aromatoleum petrolei]QTQ36470.1 Histidinol-phosphate aminotransferase [Aromatoleum petrolei]
MDFVMPQLAVGSRADAADGAALAAAGIDALLSLAPLARPAEVALQLGLAVADRAALPAATIREAVAFIAARLAAGHRVLLHCEQGISRSPALAACFLHEQLGVPLDEAVDRVRAARPQADPHPALLASIRAHYAGTDHPAVDLSGNENPLGPSPAARAAIVRSTARLHRYPPADTAALRDALARRLGLSAEQFVIGNGACDLIDLALRAIVGAGGEVLIPDPAFPAYRSAAARVGARVVTVPLAGSRYALDEYLARLTPATRLVVVASPHNPTGTLMDPADWARLRGALPAGAVLLLDEAYRDYAEGHELIDAAADVRAGAAVLTLRSLSKVEGLAGLRVGYGFAPEALVRRLASLCPQYHVGSLAQVAALAALEDEAHRRASIVANARERERLMAGLARLGVDFVPSAANFVLLQGAPRDARARLAARGVAVKDMARYGLPGDVRVSVGLRAENARFLTALGELLCEDHQRRAAVPA